jgi:anaerobic nitric oxide reductase transcription regulator
MSHCAASSISALTSAISQLELDISFAARSESNVLVTGENSHDRRCVADAIHRKSRRAGGPLIVMNGADLVVSSGDELETSLTGCLANASNGALLIEEIQQIPALAQEQLLRVVELAVDRSVRLITTASSDWFAAVQANQFSAELFYRLNIIHLVVPSTSIVTRALEQPSFNRQLSHGRNTRR